MQAIKAVYDGVGFTPKQPIPVQGYYDVVILFVEPTVPDSDDTNAFMNADIAFWREHKKLLADSKDESLSLDDFTRSKINRELILFEDED